MKNQKLKLDNIARVGEITSNYYLNNKIKESVKISCNSFIKFQLDSIDMLVVFARLFITVYHSKLFTKSST